MVFDLNGVLTHPPTPARRARLRRLTSLDAATLERLYWVHRPPYDRGRIDSAEYWGRIGADGGRIYPAETICELVGTDAELWGRPNRATVSVLRAVAASPLRTAICSNTPRDVWDALARRHRWMSTVDVATLSCDVGLTKPDPGIYRHCLAALGVLPAAVLLVDDRAENVAAAAALGMHACHFEASTDPATILARAGLGAAL